MTMTTTKNIGLVVLGVIVGLLFLGAYVVNNQDDNQNVGGVYSTSLQNFESIKVGDSGSQATFIKSGTCTLTSNTSIAATSTGTGTCATVGSRAGDQVFISLATTTIPLAGQFHLSGAVAGTDTTTVGITNLTGTARVPGSVSGFGSSTNYYIIRAR